MFGIGISPEVVGKFRFGIEFNGFGVIGNGFVKLVEFPIGISPVVVGLSRFGIEFNGFGVIGNGLV